MKKSTKLALGIGTAVAAVTAFTIKAIFGKNEETVTTDCVEGECNEVEDSEESTENVEN